MAILSPPAFGREELLNGPSLSVFGARCSSGTAERIGNISITRLYTPISQIMKMRPPVGSAVLPESSMGNPGKRLGGSGASRKRVDENFMVYRIYNRVRSIRSLSRCIPGLPYFIAILFRFVDSGRGAERTVGRIRFRRNGRKVRKYCTGSYRKGECKR